MLNLVEKKHNSLSTVVWYLLRVEIDSFMDFKGVTVSGENRTKIYKFEKITSILKVFLFHKKVQPVI